MRRITILWAVWCATACQALPEDHALRGELERSYERVRHGFDVTRYVESEARRLPRLMRTTRSLTPLEGDDARRVARLPETARALLRREAAGPRHLGDTAHALVRHETHGAARLARNESSLHRVASVERAARRLEHAAANVPVLLGRDRQVLSSPTDRQRQTETEPGTRRESWIERIARRLRL